MTWYPNIYIYMFVLLSVCVVINTICQLICHRQWQQCCCSSLCQSPKQTYQRIPWDGLHQKGQTVTSKGAKF